MATYNELRTRSQQVRDEVNIGGNTALRVGQLLMDMAEYFQGNDEAASQYLAEHFAMLNVETGGLAWQVAPIVILQTMGSPYDSGDYTTLSAGQNFYRTGYIQEADGGGGGINGERPRQDVLYVNFNTLKLYTWNGASFDQFPTGGDVVNNLTTGGVDKALSAEMGKRLKEKVEEVQANIQRLYNNLGNIAFWDATAKSAAAPIPLDWGGTKHLVTLDLNLTNAVVKHNGTAVANGATIQVEEYDTLTLLVEASTGYVLQSVTSSTTGAVVTDNGNGTYNVALTMGQNNVTLAITATAAQAYTITYGTMTNCSVVTSPAPTSILGGQSVEIEFSAESGYELDSSCFTVANADKAWDAATSKLTISNATDNVTISAEAEVPKLKFLKGYRMLSNGTITNAPYTAGGVDISGLCALSEYIKVPTLGSSATQVQFSVKWGYSSSNDNVNYVPVQWALFRKESDNTFTFLSATRAWDANVDHKDARGTTDATAIAAGKAGTLYLRSVLAMNSGQTALVSGVYIKEAAPTATNLFVPTSSPINYRLVDAEDWDIDDLNS